MPIERIKDIHIGLCIDEGTHSNAIDFGFALAQAARSHVTLQAVSTRLAIPQSALSDMGASLVAEENERRIGVAKSAAETWRKNAAAQGSPCTALALHFPFSEAVSAFGRQSRLHDVTILDPGSDGLCLERALIEEVLFKCGRPALVVPEGYEAFRLDHVMVAWDGSAQATRALNDALPLLAAAKTVNLVSVAEAGKGDVLPGADIVPHLERHGVQAILVDLDASSDVEMLLRDQSHAHRTDLIVMGAYAHSWWRELVLGGVTRSFLIDPPAPLFLSR